MSATIPFQRHKLSVEDYHRMGETGILEEGSRVELIEGELIDMAPIGSPHASVLASLNMVLARQIVEGRAILWTQNPVSLPPYSEPQPDFMLLRPRSDRYFDALPTAADVILLVEVSDSSLSYDRGMKLALYARDGIAEFWIVDVKGRCLEVHRNSGPSGYSTCVRPAFTEEVSPLGLAEVRISASQLFPPHEPDRHA